MLDKDGSGVIDAGDIVDAYDTSKHPDVIAGKKSSQEVLGEFLDTFDVGGVHDGMVTTQEWMNYYENISSSIDMDDYFELMIRNAWHLSGGEGWCANSANKRVLVTHLLKKVYTVSVEMLKGKGQPPTGPQHAKAQRAIAATAQRAPAVDVALDNATPEQVGPAAISQGDGRKVRRRSLGSAFKGLFGKRSASPKLDAGGDSVV